MDNYTFKDISTIFTHDELDRVYDYDVQLRRKIAEGFKNTIPSTVHWRVNGHTYGIYMRSTGEIDPYYFNAGEVEKNSSLMDYTKLQDLYNKIGNLIDSHEESSRKELDDVKNLLLLQVLLG